MTILALFLNSCQISRKVFFLKRSNDYCIVKTSLGGRPPSELQIVDYQQILTKPCFTCLKALSGVKQF